MAAIYWHLLIADKILQSLRNGQGSGRRLQAIVSNADHFFIGAVGPDLHYFPGGEATLSQLAHRDEPVDLGLSLLAAAADEKEEAFACGWMLHIVTDLVTHEMVNRHVAEKLHAGRRKSFPYSLDPRGHYRIEWGIDVFWLENPIHFQRVPKLRALLKRTADVAPLLANTFLQRYGKTVPPKNWQAAAAGMARAVRFFRRSWRVSGRIRDRRRFVQCLKSFFYGSVVLPMAWTGAIFRPKSGLGILIPIVPGKGDTREILETTDRACLAYQDHLLTAFRHLKNRSLEG